MADLKVSVVIPAKNECRNIGWVLRRVPDWVEEIIVVDGLSVDDTLEIAQHLSPKVRVVHDDRPGKGVALRAGFEAARGDVIVMLDADGSMSPEEIPLYVNAIEAGADFVKGSRFLPRGGSDDFTFLRRTGNQVLVAMTNLLFMARFTDLCYGYMAFRREHLGALRLRSDGFEIETEMVVNAVKARLRIAEVPSVELCRRYGKSNLRVYRDGKRVLKTMMRARFRGWPADEVVIGPARDLTVTQARTVDLRDAMAR